jgi:hypothetical protein
MTLQNLSIWVASGLGGMILAGMFGGWICVQKSPPPWSQTYGYFPGDDIERLYADHQPTAKTPHGVQYDDEGQQIDPNRIDLVVDRVELCLVSRIDRERFVLFVPAFWALSCDGTQQSLPVSASVAGCHASVPDSECVPTSHCHYRAVVARPNVIVSTPSLYLLQDALIRFLYRSSDPYVDSRIKHECLTPMTKPLDYQ